MDFLKSLSGWIGQITEILLGLVALAIVLQILFGGGAAFLRMRYAKEIEIFGKGNDQQLWQYVGLTL